MSEKMLSKTQVTRNCTCGRISVVTVETDKLNRYKCGELIQNVFPDLSAFDREVLISGLCYDCQSEIFHKPKPGEDWGKILGECDCCGSTLYENDVKDNVVRCASCNSHYQVDENGISFEIEP